jgi:hypothetical protein
MIKIVLVLFALIATVSSIHAQSSENQSTSVCPDVRLEDYQNGDWVLKSSEKFNLDLSNLDSTENHCAIVRVDLLIENVSPCYVMHSAELSDEAKKAINRLASGEKIMFMVTIQCLNAPGCRRVLTYHIK